MNVDFPNPIGIPPTIPIDLPGYDIVYMLEIDSVSACPAPTASFAFSTNGLTSTFTDGSTTSGPGYYLWTFGDGIGGSIDQNPSYTYLLAGTYTACLLVTDSCGVDSACQTIVVNNTTPCPPPAADFSFSTSGLAVSFTDGSTTSGTGNYLWTFGDIIGISTDQNPTYTYLVAGTYTACLVVTDICGVDTTCQTVTVTDTPVGIHENNKVELDVFPNPVNGFLTVKGIIGRASIYDVHGRLMIITETPSIDLREFPKGIYFIRVSDDRGRVQAAKFVKE